MAPVATTIQLALFKNGVEIPNTRFETGDPGFAIFAAGGSALNVVSFFQLSGNATITAVPTDSIELRLVNTFSLTLQGSDNTVVIASLNISKVSIP